MTILIPAFEPNIRLVDLVSSLKQACDYAVIVVDDGSGSAFRPVFDKVRTLGCTILTYSVNCGKGRALKTGFEYILKHTEEKTGVVTADADGQHTVPDIIRVAKEIPLVPDQVVLGSRRFTGRVPIRSRIGNSITRIVFTMASGNRVYDTQTGLRDIPISLIPWMLKIDGERFEYEMQVLLEVGPSGYGFRQIIIETVYRPENSSHFHTVRDSIHLCFPFLKFCMSGIISAVADYILLFLFQWMIGSL